MHREADLQEQLQGSCKYLILEPLIMSLNDLESLGWIAFFRHMMQCSRAQSLGIFLVFQQSLQYCEHLHSHISSSLEVNPEQKSRSHREIKKQIKSMKYVVSPSSRHCAHEELKWGEPTPSTAQSTHYQRAVWKSSRPTAFPPITFLEM